MNSSSVRRRSSSTRSINCQTFNAPSPDPACCARGNSIAYTSQNSIARLAAVPPTRATNISAPFRKTCHCHEKPVSLPIREDVPAIHAGWLADPLVLGGFAVQPPRLHLDPAERLHQLAGRRLALGNPERVPADTHRTP